jgi:hypothetical protein
MMCGYALSKAVGRYGLNEAGNAASYNYDVKIVVCRHSGNERPQPVMQGQDR